MPNLGLALADLILAVADRLAKAKPIASPAIAPPASPPTSSTIPPGAPPMPSPSPATLIYKCARCDTVFPAYPLSDGPGMWRAILTACNQLGPGGPAKLPMAIEHVCGDGRRGAGYVVGMDDATAG